MDPKQLEAAQKSDMEWAENTIAAAESRIAALDQNLRPEALRQREAEIRQALAAPLGERLRAMVERAEAASALARQHQPEAVLRRARFHDDAAVDATLRLATFATLQRTSTGDLLRHLEDAIDAGNLALAEAVRLEFTSRQDSTALGADFAALFGRLTIPGAETLETLQRVHMQRAMTEARMGEAVSGRLNAQARLAAARAA